jgi:hypothetical protein
LACIPKIIASILLVIFSGNQPICAGSISAFSKLDFAGSNIASSEPEIS